MLDLTVDDLGQADTVFRIGVVPRRIDLLTSLTGLAFEEAWSGRVELVVAGHTVPVIGLDALIRNKRALGRPYDLADAEVLEKARGGH